MTESLRRRTSKWDVVVDPPVPSEKNDARLDTDVFGKDGVSISDWSSLKRDTMVTLPAEMNSDSSIISIEIADADKYAKWSQRENGDVRMLNPCSLSPHFSKPLDMGADRRDSPKHSYRKPLSGSHTTRRDEDLNKVTDGWDNSDNFATTRSPVRDLWRQRSPSISPRRSWGKSLRSRSRSRTRSRSRSRTPPRGFRRGPDRGRSRSRSPSHGSRREPERWPGRGRTGGAVVVPCRDFAAGRCRRGSQCKFLHGDGRRQSTRYSDRGPSDAKEIGPERGRYSGGQGRETYRDSRERTDYSRDRFTKNDRPATKCQNFLEGRCRRGSECRYAHNEPSYDSDWGSRDDTRAQTHNLRDADSSGRSFGSSHKVADDPPCKFFAEGRCRRGQSCTFSHQAVEQQNDRSGYSTRVDRHNLSQNGRNQADEPVIDVLNTSHRKVDENILEQDDSRFKPEDSQFQIPRSDTIQIQPEESNNSLSYVPGQTLVHGVQNQFIACQPMQVQSFPPNVQIQQLVPPVPLTGQMQPAIFSLPQNGQGHIISPHLPSNFNIPIQDQPVLPPSQMGQNQQNHNLPGPHSGQNQQNFDLPQPTPDGQNVPTLNFSGLNHQTLPSTQSGQNQKGASQPLSTENLISNEQLMPKTDASEKLPSQVSTDAPVIQKVVTSEQAAQITNLSASLARFFGSAGVLNPEVSTGLLPLVQPSQGSFTQQEGNPMPVVNPVTPETSGVPPGFEQTDSTMKDAQTKNMNSLVATVANGANLVNPPVKSVDVEMEVVHGIKTNAAKEANGAGSTLNKKEQDGDQEADQADGESKQNKDGKAMRMFKCALVDFVKDVLKPTWKEGTLSKEAHKTIVKKVIDKVTGAMQSQNIPQSQDKIDIYMAHSKVKLTKLVKAYLEKYKA